MKIGTRSPLEAAGTVSFQELAIIFARGLILRTDQSRWITLRFGLTNCGNQVEITLTHVTGDIMCGAFILPETPGALNRIHE